MPTKAKPYDLAFETYYASIKRLLLLNDRGVSLMKKLYNFYGEEYKDITRKKEGDSRLNTIGDLYLILRKCWSKETAFPSCQSEWVDTDPSYGQCAITAMLVFDMFGGSIHRIHVNGGGTHYFNKIDGHYIDLTREQFDLYNIPVSYEPNDLMDRKYCGKNSDTQNRYNILINNISEYLKDSNKI